MQPLIVSLLFLVLSLAGCAAHEPPRCTGAWEPINSAVHPRRAADTDGQ